MHVIVDGYNVMHALPVDREWPGVSFRDRRAYFLGLIQSYAGTRKHKITVVFDGAKGGDDLGSREMAGSIEVVYSPRGVEADGIIMRMAESSSRPGEILLVSSDKSLADYVGSIGASTARADELLRKLRAGRHEQTGLSEPAADFDRGERGHGSRARKGRRQNLRLW